MSYIQKLFFTIKQQQSSLICACSRNATSPNTELVYFYRMVRSWLVSPSLYFTLKYLNLNYWMD